MEVIIEKSSGFCFGVVSAIDLVEKELLTSSSLYCLGEIVHNDMEVERLEKMGLKTISIEDMQELRDTKVMIRAHGEPPSTYDLAKKNNIEIIDATCPIVLKLQKDVHKAYLEAKENGGQILIFGKKGHAEVIGLVGQCDGNAIVISSQEDLVDVDFTKPIYLFSQTTMSKEKFEIISQTITQRAKENNPNYIKELNIKNSICKRVCSRTDDLKEFAKEMDVVLFVSGKKSSNGQYLYNLCKEANINTYFISEIEEIKKEWLETANKVGITGATSTPMWLMEEISEKVKNKKCI
ncbi:MAG: 4-hydroxy-3-methylbut-2-enyl diphosphate reductase [Bacteroidales bacterium]